METNVYTRDKIPLDARFSGPAIVEQMDTTVVIEPGNKVDVDSDGNLSIEVKSL